MKLKKTSKKAPFDNEIIIDLSKRRDRMTQIVSLFLSIFFVVKSDLPVSKHELISRSIISTPT